MKPNELTKTHLERAYQSLQGQYAQHGITQELFISSCLAAVTENRFPGAIGEIDLAGTIFGQEYDDNKVQFAEMGITREDFIRAARMEAGLLPIQPGNIGKSLLSNSEHPEASEPAPNWMHSKVSEVQF